MRGLCWEGVAGSGAGRSGVRPRAPCPAPSLPSAATAPCLPGCNAVPRKRSLCVHCPGPSQSPFCSPVYEAGPPGAPSPGGTQVSSFAAGAPTQHDTFQVGEHTASQPALRLLGVVTRAAPGSGHLGAPLSAKGCRGGAAARVGRQVLWFLRGSWAALSEISPRRAQPGERHRRGREPGCSPPCAPTAPTKQRLCPAPRRPNAHPGWPPRARPCPASSVSQGRSACPPGAPHLSALRGSPSQHHPSEKLAPNEGEICR